MAQTWLQSSIMTFLAKNLSSGSIQLARVFKISNKLQLHNPIKLVDITNDHFASFCRQEVGVCNATVSNSSLAILMFETYIALAQGDNEGRKTYLEVVVNSLTIFDGAESHIFRVGGHREFHAREQRNIEKEGINSFFAHDCFRL